MSRLMCSTDYLYSHGTPPSCRTFYGAKRHSGNRDTDGTSPQRVSTASPRADASESPRSKVPRRSHLGPSNPTRVPALVPSVSSLVHHPRTSNEVTWLRSSTGRGPMTKFVGKWLLGEQAVGINRRSEQLAQAEMHLKMLGDGAKAKL